MNSTRLNLEIQGFGSVQKRIQIHVVVTDWELSL
jgi:hypothetical protein